MCGAGFAQLNNLQKHVSTHVETDLSDTIIDEVKCTSCDETFAEYVIAYKIFAFFVKVTDYLFIFVSAKIVWKNTNESMKC